ncbi:MAG TPA: hypothetical protein VGX51_10445 [Solirubrobacteraceae bacterium]|jgi:hypothetical protein|nr:hypothetical protein [Solirubrobacteraceae bacterium]
MTTEPHRPDPPPDVCLLLRANAEARWLSNELVPVVRQLEQNPRTGTALTYLEVLRLDARRHAAETDAARLALDALEPNGDAAMYSNARRYHAAVRRLRSRVERRVTLALASAAQPDARIA